MINIKSILHILLLVFLIRRKMGMTYNSLINLAPPCRGVPNFFSSPARTHLTKTLKPPRYLIIQRGKCYSIIKSPLFRQKVFMRVQNATRNSSSATLSWNIWTLIKGQNLSLVSFVHKHLQCVAAWLNTGILTILSFRLKNKYLY